MILLLSLNDWTEAVSEDSMCKKPDLVLEKNPSTQCDITSVETERVMIEVYTSDGNLIVQ